jgi:uncharacterized protein
VHDPLDALSGVTFKVAARCNLNCSYCYVFNKGDTSWRRRPARMSQEIFEAGIARLREACLRSGREQVSVTLHGGEPTLIGAGRARAFFAAARCGLEGVADVRLVIQTNGTRLTREWVELFDEQRVDVGVSMDGPPTVHDRLRVDHRGRGSHRAVRRGVELLREGGVPFAVLSVVNFDADPLDVHEHFWELGADRISYLMPHVTHDDIAEVTARYGPTPCLDWLGPVLDHWWNHGTLGTDVQPFTSMARVILGGPSDLDLFGGAPLGFCFVETDGDIEGLDVLKICEDGFAGTAHNVLTDGFDAFAAGAACMPRRSFAAARCRPAARPARRPGPAAAATSRTATCAAPAWIGPARGAATCLASSPSCAGCSRSTTARPGHAGGCWPSWPRPAAAAPDPRRHGAGRGSVSPPVGLRHFLTLKRNEPFCL